MTNTAPPTVDLVMPVYNEGASIYETGREWMDYSAASGIPIRLVLSEDGSRDNTVEELRRLEADFGALIISEPVRKGYSKAVVDGIRATTADLTCVVDSDGQCDPRDLERLLARNPDFETVISGIRTPRADTALRRSASGAFNGYYRMRTGVSMSDPSCPYVLGTRDIMHRIAQRDPLLPQGYWWEFHARRAGYGINAIQIPTAHRIRLDGESRVYSLRNMYKIGWNHARALSLLEREIKSSS